MKVELEIDGNQLGSTVIELFQNLKPEDKKELAEKVLLAWMKEPMDTEYRLKEQQVIEHLREGREHYKFKGMADNEIKQQWRFKECIKTFKCIRDLMLHDLCRESVEYVQKALKRLIKLARI